MTFPTFVNFFVQKRFLFVFKHFWRNHEQNNMPQINLYLIRNHYRQCFNDMCKTHPCMQCTIYIYLKVLQFLGMVQISFALNIPSGEFALHPFCKLNFWFYIQNTICCECNCRYPTIDVIGLMLYRHIYYLKCRRRTK